MHSQSVCGGSWMFCGLKYVSMWMPLSNLFFWYTQTLSVRWVWLGLCRSHDALQNHCFCWHVYFYSLKGKGLVWSGLCMCVQYRFMGRTAEVCSYTLWFDFSSVEAFEFGRKCILKKWALQLHAVKRDEREKMGCDCPLHKHHCYHLKMAFVQNYFFIVHRKF